MDHNSQPRAGHVLSLNLWATRKSHCSLSQPSCLFLSPSLWGPYPPGEQAFPTHEGWAAGTWSRKGAPLCVRSPSYSVLGPPRTQRHRACCLLLLAQQSPPSAIHLFQPPCVKLETEATSRPEGHPGPARVMMIPKGTEPGGDRKWGAVCETSRSSPIATPTDLMRSVSRTQARLWSRLDSGAGGDQVLMGT